MQCWLERVVLGQPSYVVLVRTCSVRTTITCSVDWDMYSVS